MVRVHQDLRLAHALARQCGRGSPAAHVARAAWRRVHPRLHLQPRPLESVDAATAQARSRLRGSEPRAGIRQHRRLRALGRARRAPGRDDDRPRPHHRRAQHGRARRARLAAHARRAQAQRRHRRGRAPDHHRHAAPRYLVGAPGARRQRAPDACRWRVDGRARRQGAAHVAGPDHQLVERVRPDRLPVADGHLSGQRGQAVARRGAHRADGAGGRSGTRSGGGSTTDDAASVSPYRCRAAAGASARSTGAAARRCRARRRAPRGCPSRSSCGARC